MGKWKLKKHDIVMMSIIILVGATSWYVNSVRVTRGFFTDANWIFIDGIMYTILSALIVGYVVSEVLRTGKH